MRIKKKVTVIGKRSISYSFHSGLCHLRHEKSTNKTITAKVLELQQGLGVMDTKSHPTCCKGLGDLSVLMSITFLTAKQVLSPPQPDKMHH